MSLLSDQAIKDIKEMGKICETLTQKIVNRVQTQRQNRTIHQDFLKRRSTDGFDPTSGNSKDGQSLLAHSVGGKLIKGLKREVSKVFKRVAQFFGNK
jgi:hypothetical protein